MGSQKKHKVSYFYDPDVGNYYYGQGHPMKPHRVRMAHDLILRYDLYSHMDVFRPVPATTDDLTMFHSEDYISFLSTITVDKKDKFKKELDRYNLNQDCPVFDGIFNYCQIYTGGSIGGAIKLNYRDSDIVINWAGGLHHAKKSEASGFCYVNDIVLAILELLKHHQRVLYLDIDVHHGDGVEEAFLTTDRVMTVSFHKFGDNFFPNTGSTDSIGHAKGLHYSVNVPLDDGVDDQSYFMLFKPIMQKVMDVYQPEVIVLQSGADSLAGDRLGVFNLSIRAHAECHRFMKSFGVPMLVLGGGGYKIKNVARCWTYETGVLLGLEENMSNQLPANEYYDYYGPDYQLHIQVDEKANMNKHEKLLEIRDKILDNLSKVRPPGVAFHDVPPDAMTLEQVNGVV